MVATPSQWAPVRWAFFALPAPAQNVVRTARERVRTPKIKSEKPSRRYSEEELCRFAEVILRSGQFH